MILLACKISRYLYAGVIGTQTYTHKSESCAPLFARVPVPRTSSEIDEELYLWRITSYGLDELYVSCNASRSYRSINNKPRTALHVAGSDRAKDARRGDALAGGPRFCPYAFVIGCGRVSQSIFMYLKEHGLKFASSFLPLYATVLKTFRSQRPFFFKNNNSFTFLTYTIQFQDSIDGKDILIIYSLSWPRFV